MGFLQNLRKTIQLLQHVDFQQIAELNQKIDLASAMNALSKLNDQQLNSLLKMMNSVQKKKELPEINPDFYELKDKLTPEQRALQLKV